MSYTDKDLQQASQIAYMYISDDDIDFYRANIDPEGYPTLQWLLTNSYLIGHDIGGKYVSKYNYSGQDKNSPGYMQYLGACELIESIKYGYADCANWKVIAVEDKNNDTGMYGLLIETSDNEAIVSFDEQNLCA